MATTKASLWDHGEELPVEVNQRSLVVKILSRYAAEFYIFRELLQNSDDAQSTSVAIHFETKNNLDGIPSESLDGKLPDLKTAVVHQWTVKNNGIVFREEDWSRLKKIADGNPDEERIGAFGVGFYSLFSITEEPFVTSGDQWMGFYWKDNKDQLYVRRGHLPEGKREEWTSFVMPLREEAPMPVAFDLARFLASSITFMTFLSHVEVYFDAHPLVKIDKTKGLPKELGVPKGFQTRSPSGTMNVKNIQYTPLHIKVASMAWLYTSGSEKPSPPSSVQKTIKSPSSGFFSSLFSTFGVSTPRATTPLPQPEPASLVDLLKVMESSVTLMVYSADVDVVVDKKMAAEMLRSTKKNPPKKLKYELVYTGKEDYDASKKEDESLPVATGSIFQALRADLEGTGSARVFIGHSTSQTTGIAGHMATRFIPTVERDSIDFMDRTISVWNKELLFVGGFLSRVIYNTELDNITALWKNAPSDSPEDFRSSLNKRAMHILRFFTFNPSTPLPEVSSLMEATFFSCCKDKLLLLSTTGVRPVSEVRLPDATFSAFLRQLPVIPDDILSEARPMVNALQSRQLLKAITFDDVLKELRAQPLAEKEMVACMRWWCSLYQPNEVNDRLLQIRRELLNAAILTVGEPGTSTEKIIALHSIRSFINTRGSGAYILSDGPLPDNVIPHFISKQFQPEQLTASFPWTELTIPVWLHHLCNTAVSSANPEHDISVSAPWAEQVLTAVVRAWPSLSNEAKGSIQQLLKPKVCVPTSGGMKRPEEAYFAQANIFRDLPVVTFPSGAQVKPQMERFLSTLGVRSSVELQIIFNRMVKTNEWTVPDLIKYLVSVQSTLTQEEWQRLAVTSLFFKENSAGEVLDNAKPLRFAANQLYEPVNALRDLQLPIIDYGSQHKWRTSSEEAKFLFKLGLQRYPPLGVLVKLCASPEATLRRTALKYLLDHIAVKYSDYEPSMFSEISFIPGVKSGQTVMCTPKEVFSNPNWAAFGLPVVSALSRDAVIKLKVREHPQTSLLMSLLRSTPPKDEHEATKWFSILAEQLSQFSTSELTVLSALPIVPTKVSSEKGDTFKHLSPLQCFFGRQNRPSFHSKLFVFVDFGTVANSFLSACGTKQEPSVEEIVQMLLADPKHFFQLSGGPAHFVHELRNIAVNSKQISSGALSRMKKSPVLLCSQRTAPTEGDRSGRDLDDEEGDLVYDLKRPDEILIADDTAASQLFGHALYTAPQEDQLEVFYLQLGSRRLSSLVKEDHKTSVELSDHKVATAVRALVLERLPLFLHEHTHAKTKVAYGWLTEPDHFVVKTYGKIQVTKSLTFGTIRLERILDTTAVAKRFGYGPIQLWIASNVQLDMYDVATSLNRFIFESPKANDALLFMTILSTDLRSLKRRGYNVDRILRQQKADREAVEAAQKAKIEEKNLIQSDPTPIMPPKPAAGAITGPPPAYSDSGDARSSKSSSVFKSFQSLRHKVGESIGLSSHGEGSAVNPNLRQEIAEPPTQSAPKPPERLPNQGVTPLTNISSNIDMAIKACRPEYGNLLRNTQEMQQVKELLNEGYCDISGQVGDLIYLGAMTNIKIYVTEGVPEKESFMSRHDGPLQRITPVMSLLSGIFKLPLTSLHIFYDVAGSLIAFNRNGSIFFNLRYWEAWHDADVAKGDRTTAMISWYFTLAHEIAHNLVQPHNSEHEFYFSVICEKHLVELAKYL